ncbi:periplasmic heavy metal sensor [Temperatibacter marinus]|uniref:Periplasmic heavy metal sensor n=1 Tax=Temperatibacter marinus TaxID=1456591 RepID=A0AA52EKH8_9PROT|nr:periplasmic heavy metal sensor [Temperatibacter marinus]WND03686.1 periplasmic heavy metal sensor [Temperatibacter marinus]
MKKSATWILVLLGLSLSINLFMAGLFVGESLTEPKREGQFKSKKKNLHKVDFSMRRLASFLPAEKRKVFRPFLKENKKSINALIQGHIRSRHEVLNLIEAEILDVNALKIAFEKERAMKVEIDILSHQGFLYLLENLSWDERQALASAITEARINEFRGKRGYFRPKRGKEGREHQPKEKP